MQESSPGNSVAYQGQASMQRTAYGLLVMESNGRHLFGSVVPPGLYLSPSKLKPWHSSEIGATERAGGVSTGGGADGTSAPLPAAWACGSSEFSASEGWPLESRSSGMAPVISP